MNSWNDVIGFVALSGWAWIGWWALGRAARRAGTSRLGLIGALALVRAIFGR